MMTQQELKDLDAWCSFGLKYVEWIGPASVEYMPALRRLKVLLDRRVRDLRIEGCR